MHKIPVTAHLFKACHLACTTRVLTRHDAINAKLTYASIATENTIWQNEPKLKIFVPTTTCGMQLGGAGQSDSPFSNANSLRACSVERSGVTCFLGG